MIRITRHVIVSIYILRTTLTSVGWPLIMSILNDYVAKENRCVICIASPTPTARTNACWPQRRSKWNSLQNIAGSSAVFYGKV